MNEKIKNNDPLDVGYRMSKNMAFLSLGLMAVGVAGLDFNNPIEKAQFFEDMVPPLSGSLIASFIGMAGFKIPKGVKFVHEKIKNLDNQEQSKTKFKP